MLGFLGRQARWILLGGIALCFFIPEVSRFLRPALPFLVCVVLGLAMARVDMVATLRASVQPGRLGFLFLVMVVLMPVSAGIYRFVATAVGLDTEMVMALVYLAAAPPIASTGTLCFILGYNARLAVEVTVASMLLTPVLGPLTVALFLPGEVVITPVELAVKLFLMIAGACLFALVLNLVAGRERLMRYSTELDGVGVIALIVFVIPLFDGVPQLLAADPVWGLKVLVLATIANIGVNLLVQFLAGLAGPPGDTGALGVLFGNRTIAIYLAALPFIESFSVFVALYQVPMLLTPLILRAFSFRNRSI
ncbi:hypothetical protein [Amaricoccus tamworthensis]|uniref:hypothetical protein n=1 Tax=Amaricoccus tamworthensis TaxID=57002 RepID=UPI003C7A9B19